MCESYPGARYRGMLGRQNDDTGGLTQQNYTNETWDGFSQSFRDERWQAEYTAEPLCYETSSAEASGRVSAGEVTSPPLSSFAVLLKDADELAADLDFDSLARDAATHSGRDIFHDDLDITLTMQDAAELVNFKLGQSKRAGDSAGTAAVPMVQPEASIKPMLSKRPMLDYQSFSSSDDDDAMIFSRTSRFTSAGLTTGTENQRENDRGSRKKSREKMRRQEVNVQFEMLVNLLGLSDRVRKQKVLHEAASAVKSLKRECNQLRHDRDFLHQELSRMSAHLQFANYS